MLSRAPISALVFVCALVGCTTAAITPQVESVNHTVIKAPNYPLFPYCFDDAGSVTLTYRADAAGEISDIQVESTTDERFNRSAVRALKSEGRADVDVVGDDVLRRTYVFEPVAECETSDE